ncbi:hypothetical protein [Streptomyces sp. 142MFCol3.1]|uniref:hypothetical protein n=1 Tax=Streptomyces sp. 142MFCol3.1 TaxID=1172179 RepID=UPI0004254C47|nr:hypothetical protein [Streptomyces sp. 142MFCol3.1]
MGDYFERVVDLDVAQEEAPELGARLVDWLVAEQIVTRQTDATGVYSLYVNEGHVPGPHWPRAVADAGWEPGPLAVVTGRHHHVAGQGEDDAEYVDCPRCGARTTFIDYPASFEADPALWGPFRAAVETWEATGRGSAVCRSCGAASPVTEWRWPDAYALGALTFEFWGWPPLSDTFVAELSDRLGRHRTARHTGKF